jgi:cystathionine beta-lyase
VEECGAPVEHVLHHGRVLLDGGASFGPGAEEYLRLNFATSHDILEEILDGMTKALTRQISASRVDSHGGQPPPNAGEARAG